jgi:hypothetical protein
MKGGTLSVLVLAVCAAAALADHKDDFNAIEHRLDHLTHDLVALEKRIEKRVDKERIGRARNARNAIQRLTGNGCGGNEFQCGMADPQCISALEVCDGIRDCRNGMDENNCDLPVHEGDVFEGHMVWDHCTKRKPEIMTIRITDVTTTPFKSAVSVTANVGIDIHHGQVHAAAELPAHGFYSHGLRRLVLDPPEADRLALSCQFGDGLKKRCIGDITYEASGEVCAKLIFVRQ